jgi:hypothetical protein
LSFTQPIYCFIHGFFLPNLKRSILLSFTQLLILRNILLSFTQLATVVNKGKSKYIVVLLNLLFCYATYCCLTYAVVVLRNLLLSYATYGYFVKQQLPCRQPFFVVTSIKTNLRISLALNLIQTCQPRGPCKDRSDRSLVLLKITQPIDTFETQLRNLLKQNHSSLMDPLMKLIRKPLNFLGCFPQNMQILNDTFIEIYVPFQIQFSRSFF